MDLKDSLLARRRELWNRYYANVHNNSLIAKENIYRVFIVRNEMNFMIIGINKQTKQIVNICVFKDNYGTKSAYEADISSDIELLWSVIRDNIMDFADVDNLWNIPYLLNDEECSRWNSIIKDNKLCKQYQNKRL